MLAYISHIISNHAWAIAGTNQHFTSTEMVLTHFAINDNKKSEGLVGLARFTKKTLKEDDFHELRNCCREVNLFPR